MHAPKIWENPSDNATMILVGAEDPSVCQAGTSVLSLKLQRKAEQPALELSAKHAYL